MESVEDVNSTFPAFRELQNQWKAITMVPQNRAKDLWESYQLYVEQFYDYIKINNEFRDLDFKKNLELKTKLCEKAEALENEPNIVTAFKELQKLHEEWKELGPVAKEYRESIWERFKAITTVINKKHQNFFEGLIFHRVIKGFMIQGGDPEGIGVGGPGYSIKGEFAANGFENNLKHTAGVLSMARSMNPNSAGSQFFIMHKDAPHLDGSYAAFGKIIEGMDVVNKIAEVRTDWNDKPMEPQVMEKVVVDTFGVEYPEPEKF